MPRGGVTGGTGLFFQVGRLRFGSPDLPRERAQSLAQCALGIPAVIPGGRDEGEERVAELIFGRRSRRRCRVGATTESR